MSWPLQHCQGRGGARGPGVEHGNGIKWLRLKYLTFASLAETFHYVNTRLEPSGSEGRWQWSLVSTCRGQDFPQHHGAAAHIGPYWPPGLPAIRKEDISSKGGAFLQLPMVITWSSGALLKPPSSLLVPPLPVLSALDPLASLTPRGSPAISQTHRPGSRPAHSAAPAELRRSQAYGTHPAPTTLDFRCLEVMGLELVNARYKL